MKNLIFLQFIILIMLFSMNRNEILFSEITCEGFTDEIMENGSHWESSRSIASNAIYHSWNTSIVVFENNTILFSTLNIFSPTVSIQSLIRTIPGDIWNVQTIMNQSSLPVILNHTITKIGSNTQLEIHFPHVINNTNIVELFIQFHTDGYLEQRSELNHWQFLYQLSGEDIESLWVTIFLPKEYSFEANGNDLEIYPKFSTNYTNNVYNVYIWPEQVLQKGEIGLIYYIVFIIPIVNSITIIQNQTITTTVTINNDNLIFNTLLLLIGIVIGFISLLLWNNRQMLISNARRIFTINYLASTENNRVEYKAVHLSIPEQKIIKTIETSNGEIYQSILLEQINLSKSNLSMYLSRLEKEGFIEKSKIGRENVIKLKEKITTQLIDESSKKKEDDLSDE